jgi:hypothetical protein
MPASDWPVMAAARSVWRARDDVVEVAAHLVQLARRRVSGLDLGSGDLRQRLRQQGALEDVRDARALGVEPRPFHGGAGAPGKALRDSQVGF